MKRFLFIWLPVLLIAGLIFYSSSEPYSYQNIQPEISRYMNTEMITKWFSGVSFQYGGKEVSVGALGAAGFLEFFIRKAAHFTVYFVLAFLLCRALWHSLFRKYRKIVLWALFLAALYAAFDELHQSLTPDRSPHLVDVGLDMVGAAIGTLVSFLVYRWEKD